MSAGGTSRPSALAVIRLTTRSNLVGCSTGMSAGFVPPLQRPGSRRDDYVNLLPNQLTCEFGQALDAALCPTILDGNRAAFDPPQFAQPLQESDTPFTPSRARCGSQEPDRRQLVRLLRVRSTKRPRCRAAEHCYELAPLHSITSSARPSSVSGKVMPSALAVSRLIASSTVVGCSTGTSLGLVPCKTLTSWRANCRNS